MVCARLDAFGDFVFVGAFFFGGGRELVSNSSLVSNAGDFMSSEDPSLDIVFEFMFTTDRWLSAVFTIFSVKSDLFIE